MRFGTSFFALMLANCFSLLLHGYNEPVAIGNWRIHLPYNNVTTIAETPERIYCAAAFGLFAYNKSDGTTERLSPINGFGGYSIQALQYGESSRTLVIAYADGKIELLKDQTITKNDDIYRKTIVGNKRIYHINIVGDIAYLSTSFGLMELDLVKNEMRNSYQYIGPNGATIDIFSSCATTDSIFISTKQGILSGSLADGVNLYYFQNWHLSKKASIESRHVAAFNQNIYAEIDSQLYIKKNNTWSLFRNYQKAIVTNIDVNHQQLIIGVYGRQILKVKDNGDVDSIGINILNQCLLAGNGQIWYASPGNGLVYKPTNGNEINYYPNGPRATTSYQFVNAYNNLWAMAGSVKTTTYSPTFNGNKYYYFDNFSWTSSPDNAITYPLYDFTIASYQKQNGRLYIGTHGAGLLQMNNGVPVKVFNDTNSPLRKRANSYVYITGLTTDNKNNLWISNWDVDTSLYQLTPSGVWTGYKLPVGTTGKILIDSRNNKWILGPKSNVGMVAFTDKGTATKTDDVAITLNTAKGTGNLPSNTVNDIAFTKAGEMLIGTDAGYALIRNPNNAFTGGNYDAQRVIVAVEAGTNLGGYLLEKEIINCIVVDGGDRRWFGTNRGAWLFDSDGETLLKHFTTENSPLMSDNVLSIGIMESTGEVFFGTELGIVSYKSDALAPTKDIDKLVIYPNPVRPEFDGEIAITGMPDNTLVKITDINGALIYQTYSNGGMATWNCRTFDGNRPSTGVYLAFCINSDGSQTEVGKILFIK